MRTWRVFKRWALGLLTHSPETCAVAMPDLLQLIIAQVDVGTGMNVRCVSVACRDAVARAGLQPLPGFEEQQALQGFLRAEGGIWTLQRQDALAQTVSRHREITEAMRVTLVNWLIEVHYKFRTLSDRCMHQTVQIFDHYMATVPADVVGRPQYQRVGVTAFKIASAEVSGTHIHVRDLAWITNGSSTADEITACEQLMRDTLDEGFLGLPNASDFLPRLCAAARLDLSQTLARSLVLFFLDVAALCSDVSPLPPSLLASAAIFGALRVLSQPPWTPQLEYYSTHAQATVHALTDRLEGAALTVQAPGLQGKYQQPRWSGRDDATGAQRCWPVIAAYLDQKRAAQVPAAG